MRTRLRHAAFTLRAATRPVLAGMAYRYDDLRDLLLAHDWTTVAVVWRQDDRHWHGRNPFPVGAVVEDPATGTRLRPSAATCATQGCSRHRPS